MKITRDTTLFFDASVLVTGAHSRTGGSALLLEACKLGGFTAQVTSLVRFYDVLAGVDWRVLPVPFGERLEAYASLIEAKHLHVLAAAVEGKSDYLLTLDRKHILAPAGRVEGGEPSDPQPHGGRVHPASLCPTRSIRLPSPSERSVSGSGSRSRATAALRRLKAR